ncbi:MAG: four helix bundle protein [Bacteroidota bacterium]
MKSYKDLDIFQEAKRLAIEIHKISLTLPKFELYEEGSQIRRSSKAIAALIVEGYGRKRYKADFIKYLVYSHAECDETILHLEFLSITDSFKNEEKFNVLYQDYQSLSRRINKFIQYVEDNWNDFPDPE